jgi:hypothetical protein
MTWNYRLMAHQNETEITFKIHEVYYNENDIPYLYDEGNLVIDGENMNDINQTLEYIQDALKLPVLWAGERFPEHYTGKI